MQSNQDKKKGKEKKRHKTQIRDNRNELKLISTD